MEFQEKINNKIRCLICPRQCILNEGQEGFCHVRKNQDGKIILTTYGYNTGLAIDPVEKKPLYHFYPKSKILSFGTLGCCMGCKFCQNYQTTKSKAPAENGFRAAPGDIIAIAKKYNVESVAFTYNDPVVFFEYALDTAKLCKKAGIKTVAITSGFMNIEPAKEFFKYIDAVNIDLKAFSEEFYAKNCLAKLEPVLKIIKYAVNETPVWVELTTLLIENENDSSDMIKRECGWILKNLNENVPLHFSAFTPRYKFSGRKKTDNDTLFTARKIALNAGLNYVYTGNIPSLEATSTYCKNCGKLLIARMGVYKNNLKDGCCVYCKTPLDGKF